MSGGFSSGRRFWGNQLTVPGKKYTINVDISSAELHISKAILKFTNPHRFSHVCRTINIFVEYLEVRSGPDNLFSTPWRNGVEQEFRTCLVCSLNTQDKSEVDVDLNFVVGNRKVSIYFQDDYEPTDIGATVNLSGYVVGG